jgi:hypothetical protein
VLARNTKVVYRMSAIFAPTARLENLTWFANSLTWAIGREGLAP